MSESSLNSNGTSSGSDDNSSTTNTDSTEPVCFPDDDQSDICYSSGSIMNASLWQLAVDPEKGWNWKDLGNNRWEVVPTCETDGDAATTVKRCI